MKYRILRIEAVVVAGIVVTGAIAALPLFSLNAVAQIAVSSNDSKVVLVNGVVTVPANPVDDTVTVINLGVSPPKVVAEFKAPSSVAGPPQNVAVAPDESFALVASSMKLDPADPKKQVPDNRISVIDLKAKPPAVIATLESGLGANGMAINKAGTLALVANRHEGTVSIFTIAGNKLTAAGKIDFGDPKSSPSAVAFTPDGKTALVTRDGDHRISVLSVDGSKVTDTKRVMTGGHRPYAIEVSPKGDIAVVGNQGANAGDIMPVNVIDLSGKAAAHRQHRGCWAIHRRPGVLRRWQVSGGDSAERLESGAEPSILQRSRSAGRFQRQGNDAYQGGGS